MAGKNMDLPGAMFRSLVGVALLGLIAILASAFLLHVPAWIAGFGALLLAGLLLAMRVPRRRARHFVTEALVRVLPALGRGVVERRRRSHWLKTSRGQGAQLVWGYADRHSIKPGDSFQLALSAGPGAKSVSGVVKIFRIGHSATDDRQLIWRSQKTTVSAYRVRRAGRDSELLDDTAAALGPNWPLSLTIEGTDTWRPGYYSVEFVNDEGRRDSDIAYIVVTALDGRCDVLVKFATATYQAYNRWGGHSLYDNDDDPVETRGHMVSFDRPTPSEFWDWEYYFVLWLEQMADQEGLTINYATNHDITRDPELARLCKLLISVGHDEYWSKEEFDVTYDRIFRQGGSTMFLGANTAYWQVRYTDVATNGNRRGRQLVCFKSLTDPILTGGAKDAALHATARFRDAARRPESMLMGVAYQSNFRDRHEIEPRVSYYVENNELPFFAGTGYNVGDFVADIVGYEWDNRDPEAFFAPPGEDPVEADDRLWSAEQSNIDRLPLDQIQVVFSGEAVDLIGRKGRAEAVYFESPAGAKVFSSGTIRWTWGLGKVGYTEEKFRLFNQNLVLYLLDRPLIDPKPGHKTPPSDN